MMTEISEMLTYRYASRAGPRSATVRDAAILKLYACEAYKEVADQGLQVLGGAGYTMEYDLQRHFRESRLGVIGAGTSDIQRNIIAKTMGLEMASSSAAKRHRDHTRSQSLGRRSPLPRTKLPSAGPTSPDTRAPSAKRIRSTTTPKQLRPPAPRRSGAPLLSLHDSDAGGAPCRPLGSETRRLIGRRTCLRLPTEKAMAGETKIELGAPICAGDTITLHKEIIDLYEKQGRSGALVFVVTQFTFTNQRGEQVMREEFNRIYR